MCKSTAREEYITYYLGNTTAGVRDEQHSCMLPRQWGCIYSPHTICSFATHSMWKMRGLAYMCHPVGCAWHIYVNAWKVHCSLVPENSLGTIKTRLLKGAWHVNGWYICLEGA